MGELAPVPLLRGPDLPPARTADRARAAARGGGRRRGRGARAALPRGRRAQRCGRRVGRAGGHGHRVRAGRARGGRASLPAALRAFLLTLAAVDDVCAVLVIAVARTSDLDLLALAGAAVGLVVFGLLMRARPRPGEAQDPARRAEEALRPFMAGIALPVFALTSAGVSLSGVEGVTVSLLIADLSYPGGAAGAEAAVLLASTSAALLAGALPARRGWWHARQAGR
ncbi:Na+/H+ antiporter [Actinosynnema pretiosum subsp. pretiosum]|nr:Na+/H+ antiporter [Actinosynnema pretiosum subsp. pretiosum]